MLMCKEMVWLPGPPKTEYSGPHYCNEPAKGTYRYNNKQTTNPLCFKHLSEHKDAEVVIRAI